MTNLDTGIQGAKRQSFKEGNARQLYIDLERKHPDAAADELDDLFFDLITLDRHVASLRQALAYFSSNTRFALKREREAPRRIAPAAPAPVRAAERAQRVVALSEKIKANATRMVLLDLTLPSGKQLRDATGKECIAAGGWFVAVGEQIGPRGKVGDKLTEEQLHKLAQQ